MSRLDKVLLRKMTKTCADYQLIEPGDRIMVCMSGGKDSYTLLHLLREVQRRAPFEFSLIAVNLDQGQPNYPVHLLRDYLEAEGYAYKLVARDTYSVVLDKVPEGNTYCSLCSRLRRGILYSAAQELGATKMALGHHRDDAVETLLLNLFFTGQLKSMPPKLISDDKRNVVIRPLIECAESEIIAFADERQFPILPCNLCGSQPNMYRKRIKQLLDTLEQDIPEIRNSMLAAMKHARPTHLFDPRLLQIMGVLRDEGGADPVDEALAELAG
jgi:tRNA 2-thiocytidine biosynthesis protein TtcA